MPDIAMCADEICPSRPALRIAQDAQQIVREVEVWAKNERTVETAYQLRDAINAAQLAQAS